MAHSFGGSCTLAALTSLATEKRVARLILVSAPHWGKDPNWPSSAFSLEPNYETRLANVDCIDLVYSRDDDVVPTSHLNYYLEELDSANSYLLSGTGHTFVQGHIGVIAHLVSSGLRTGREKNALAAFVRKPEDGRVYEMGRMSATFVADGDETASRLSVSEWWLEAGTVSPDVPKPHSHLEDHLFYVIDGVVSVQLESEWHDATPGTYVFIPAGTEHTFENRADTRAGFLSINNPGGFERELPAIVEWFRNSVA